MKRWFAVTFITAYLGSLSYGILCHTLGVGVASHPVMYFLVWDMFCGWAAYQNLNHIIAEGESGTLYEASPGPWGDIYPYGSKVGRQHYDSFVNHGHALALNVLRHTDHEPITRIFVIEELYAKKYDLPDAVWKRRYSGTKDKFSYFRVRREYCGEGRLTLSHASWFDQQYMLTLIDNPRLEREARNSQSFFMVDRAATSRSGVMSALAPTTEIAPVSAPLGN